MSGAGAVTHLPSGPRATSGLRRRSWWITTTPSRVTPTSISSVSAPISIASAKLGSVFSGAWPRVPRCPCRSSAMADWEANAIRRKSLFNFRTGLAHDALEDRRLGLDLGVERLGRSRRRRIHALERDPVLHVLLREADDRSLVQPAHHRRGRAGRNIEAEPEGRFVARQPGGFGA